MDGVQRVLRLLPPQFAAMRKGGMRRLLFLLAALVLLGSSAAYLVSRAEHALVLRIATDEPERLAEMRLAEIFNEKVAQREIEAALAADDVELAESFVELARLRGVAVADDLSVRVERARSAREQVRRVASRFGKGFVTGEPEGVAGFAGAATGDLFIFGDVRDLAREGSRWVRGQAVDPWITGLAAAGLAVTAGTYLTGGTAALARAGVSLLKAARRSGKIGANLATDLGKLIQTGGSARMVEVLSDLGRIEGKAGARTAIEGLRYADTLDDVAKVGRLAEKKGRATLAILKTLGRGAFVLGAAALSGALWVMGAAANIVLILVTMSALFAMLARFAWRSGRLLWRGGRCVTMRIAAAG
jgi:hypothetical protein